MSKCRYDLSEDCHNKDCLKCVLDKIRAEIKKIPTAPFATVYTAKNEALKIIDKYRKEQE